MLALAAWALVNVLNSALCGIFTFTKSQMYEGMSLEVSPDTCTLTSANFSKALACIALVAHRAGRTELQGDGVVPVSQLSFTKAEEAHFKVSFASIVGLFSSLVGLF